MREPYRACVGGGEADKAYRVTLLEEHVASITDVKYAPEFDQTKPTCNGLDGLAVGTVLPVRILDERTSAGRSLCWVNSSDVQLPPAVELGSAARRLTSYHENLLTDYTRAVDIDGCKGTLELLFISAGSGDVFAERNPNEYPPLLVDRHFYTTAAENCPVLGSLTGTATCQDTWVASIEQME